MRDGEAVAKAEGRWAPRPVLSRLLRVGIFVLPVLAALAATLVARSMLPTPTSTGGWAAWWAGLLGLGFVVATGCERIARRLLPLAMLLKLSMLFPSRAPSRFRVAREAGSLRRLNDAGDGPPKAASEPEPDDPAGHILALVTALSAHDRHTRGHAERVRVFTDLLSDELHLPEGDRFRLRWAALLHDIGKLSVAAGILNKPAELDDEEWGVVREHPNEGKRLTSPLLEWLGPWGDAIAHHHERFDGAGYPEGLAGDQISYGGRIVAVADAYDTMTSARPYSRPSATRAAREDLVANAGTQFDPDVVRAFLAISLPKLLWATGPASLIVQLPFLARLQEIGQASLSSAAQTATVTAVVGATAVGLLGPATPSATAVSKPRPKVSVEQSERARDAERGSQEDAGDASGGRQSRDGKGGGDGGGGGADSGGSGTGGGGTGNGSGGGGGETGGGGTDGGGTDGGGTDGGGDPGTESGHGRGHAIGGGVGGGDGVGTGGGHGHDNGVGHSGGGNSGNGVSGGGGGGGGR